MGGRVRLVPSGRSFQVERGQTVLAAALGSGVALDYGCGAGTCGQCLARVLRGTVDEAAFSDYVIGEAKRLQGYRLLCCVTARGDVDIEAGEAGGPGAVPVQHLQARVRHRHALAGGVTRLVLRPPRTRLLRFLPGQHVALSREGTAVRASVASCPCDGMHLEFHLSVTPEGRAAGVLLDGLDRGDVLDVDGPWGHFQLDENSHRPLVMVVEGTAFAPVKSLVEHLINLELDQPVYLVWHAHTREARYLDNQCRAWADALDAFSYLPLEGGDPADRVVRAMADLEVPPAEVDVYAAGSPAFLHAFGPRLEALGVPPERCFRDDCPAD